MSFALVHRTPRSIRATHSPFVPVALLATAMMTAVTAAPLRAQEDAVAPCADGTVGTPASAACRAARGARAALAVDEAWLADHLDARETLILHVGTDSGFAAAHLPGAQLVRLQDVSTPRAPGRNILEVPAQEALTTWAASVGLDDTRRIVVVSESEALQSATRVLFTLEVLGAGDRASLLDGGLPAWRAASRPVETGAARAPAPQGRFTARRDSSLIATMTDVDAAIAGNGARIVDARLARFHAGDGGGYPRAGHIPTAVNIPLDRVADGGRLQPLARLRTLFEEAGVRPGTPVITYCHIGQQATLLWFVARQLGFDARVYDGSFQEWSGSDRPVVGPTGR